MKLNPKGCSQDKKSIFKALGNDENLTGFSISSGGEELVSLSREDINRVNNIKRE